MKLPECVFREGLGTRGLIRAKDFDDARVLNINGGRHIVVDGYAGYTLRGVGLVCRWTQVECRPPAKNLW